ncbi:MAG: hypothetical protein Q9187_009617, partial [Circinaria calcarea]
TIEGKDTIFPEPGASVERLAKSPDDYIMPNGTCATDGSPSGSPIEGNAPAAASSGGSAAAQPNIGGVFNQGATIQTSTSTAAPPVATVLASDIPTAVPTSSSTASAAPAASADSSSVSAATVTSTASCTTPGQGVCSPNGKMIGMCDATSHVVFMAVAPGTVCSNGQMIMAPAAGKRSARFSRSHMRRHHARGLRSGSW